MDFRYIKFLSEKEALQFIASMNEQLIPEQPEVTMHAKVIDEKLVLTESKSAAPKMTYSRVIEMGDYYVPVRNEDEKLYLKYEIVKQLPFLQLGPGPANVIGIKELKQEIGEEKAESLLKEVFGDQYEKDGLSDAEQKIASALSLKGSLDKETIINSIKQRK